MKSTKHKNVAKKSTKSVKHTKPVKQSKTVVKKSLISKISNIDKYKTGLLEVDKQEDKYDKLFEQKLAVQYREFRNLKEHHMQTKKFIRILLVVVTVIIIALLILSYS